MHPQALEALSLGVLFSVTAVLVDLTVTRVLLRAGRRSGSLSLEADGEHLMTDVWATADGWIHLSQSRRLPLSWLQAPGS
ncbi:cation diffusion facilitator family transporter [Methylocaldum szegediense]|jgi:divalent metal cation (Fe/Co/Zn/Cd) transporter|nr:hypothetical protein [Methylocaldum szegediense]